MSDQRDSHDGATGGAGKSSRRGVAPFFSSGERVPISVEERERHLRWLLLLRVTAISTVLAVALYMQFLTGSGFVLLRPLYYVLLAAYVFSLAVAVAQHLGAVRWPPFAATQLAIDVVFESALVYFFMGGMRSPFIVLYLMTVGAAGVMLTQRGAFLIAAHAAVWYGFVGLGSYEPLWQWLPFGPGRWADFIGERADAPELYVRFFAMMLTCFGVAWLSSTLTRRLRETGSELEARQSELEALQRLNERIVQGMSSGLLAVESSGRVVTLNDAAAEITGRSPEEITGHPVWEVFGQSRESFESMHERLRDRRILRTERSLRDAEGEWRTLGMTVTRLGGSASDREGEGGGGAARGEHDGGALYVYMFKDLTEIRRMERELRIKERMSVLGEMAGSIAHEIRNPLASISGSLQLLRKSEVHSDDPHAAELIDIVVKESKRLSKTIEEFLGYARPGPFEPVAVDLRELAEETLALLRNSDELRPNHRLELDARGEDFVTVVDEAQIKQVFWNLARNAMQAMPNGGILTVRLDREPDSIDICFEDTGTGMSTEQIETFFQPYVSGDSRGTGLGLSIVYKILQRHDATIEIDSEPGEGTRIMLKFPVGGPHEEDEQLVLISEQDEARSGSVS